MFLVTNLWLSLDGACVCTRVLTNTEKFSFGDIRSHFTYAAEAYEKKNRFSIIAACTIITPHRL